MAASLPYNTTSINAAFPVGQGLVSTVMVGVMTLFTYMFVATSFARFFMGRTKVWDSKSTFFGVDVFFFGILLCWGGLLLSLLIISLVRYKDDLSVRDFYSPQDIANVSDIAVCLFVMFMWRITMFYNLQYSTTEDVLKGEITDIAPNDAGKFFLTYIPIGVLMYFCLMPASLGYIKSGQNNWFPSVTYGVAKELNLAAGILLSCSLGWYYTLGPFISFVRMADESLKKKFGNSYIPLALVPGEDVARTKYSIDLMYKGTVSFESGILAGIHVPKAAAMIKGWIPAYHLPRIFIYAFIFYRGASNVFLTDDLLKSAEFFVCTLLIPLGLCLLSQSYDYFFAYYIASTLWFLVIQYTCGSIITENGSLVHTVQGSNGYTGANLNFGLYLSGPANASTSLVDPTTINFNIWWATAFCIISGLLLTMGGSRVVN
jgi:hypothetical protein